MKSRTQRAAVLGLAAVTVLSMSACSREPTATSQTTSADAATSLMETTAAPMSPAAMVPGLICGGGKTANATVYMIDTVLMPPAA
jgi:hypothetical protein